MSAAFWEYLWGLIRDSFHGALRTVEIAEALAAVAVHSLGYFFPDVKDELDVVFLGIIGLFIITFFFGLLIVAYRLDKRKTEQLGSGLVLEIDQLVIGESPDQSLTSIVVVASVGNMGEPSVAEGYRMRVTLSDGTVLVPSSQSIPPALTLYEGHGQRIIVAGDNAAQEQPVIYGPQHALYERTLRPIAKGAKVRGVLMFWAHAMRREAFLGATFELTCSDIRNRPYSVNTILPKEPQSEKKYFPGLG